MATKTKRGAADALIGGYAMMKNGPDVNLSEVELENVASLEIVVMWGDNVLHVEHLTPPRAFVLGSGEGAGTESRDETDFVVPAGAFASSMPLVVVENGAPALVLPRGASGEIERVGASPVRIAELIDSQATRAYLDPKGVIQDARAIDLPAGSQATVRYVGSDLTFRVASVCAGRPVPAELLTAGSSESVKFVGASFLAHAGLLGAMAFFMPGLGGTDAESLDATNVLMMQKLLNASADREEAAQNGGAGAEDSSAADAPKGQEGAKAAGAEGKMGAKDGPSAPARFGIKKTSDGPPQLSRSAMLDEAREFGMNELLASASPKGPSAAWGGPPNGNDATDADGLLMFGGVIGDSAGFGGLGLHDTGEGGGGTANLIGLDRIGELGGGHPWGNCTGAHCGNGGPGGDGPGGPGGHGHSPSGLRPHVPTIKQPREPHTDVGGKIDPAVIQRIVRMNFGRFRGCYEDGLRTNPSLTGRVEVKFLIGRDGQVVSSKDAGSDLPDQKVVQCVVRNFGPLSFPQPEGGVVGVTYPLVFSPGE